MTSSLANNLLELALELKEGEFPLCAIIERKSDSLISFSAQTLKKTFEQMRATNLFHRIDLNGPQIVIFISGKKLTSPDANINFLKSGKTINSGQSITLAKQLVKYESRPLSLKYLHRSSICQYNENINAIQELIRQNKFPEALGTLEKSDDESILYSKEMLQVEILRKQGKQELADSILEEIGSSTPYDIFSTNLLISDLTGKAKLSRENSAPMSLDLLIYDRIFPSLHCSFTTCEFNAYLENIPRTKTITSGIDFPEGKDFAQVIDTYANHYPKNADLIEKIGPITQVDAKVYYTLFLGNAHAILPLVEANKASLIFTLYSGGEFCLNDQSSDLRLKEVFDSPAFKKVVVVQKPIYDYLIENQLVEKSKIEFIYGPICNTDFLIRNRQHKVHYPHGKKTFDIAFVANKNMPRGEDKGYDTFIATALILLAHSDVFNFHIVGGFDDKTIPLGLKAGNFHFYGHRPMHFFPNFYSGIDIMMSPCRPFVLAPGAIDGAPNVSAIEAGLSGTAVFVTDQLNQNIEYAWDEEIVRLTDSPQQNADKVLEFFLDTDALYKLSRKGCEAFARVNSFDTQILPRIKLLQKAINDHK